jgi:hypothetical protein
MRLRQPKLMFSRNFARYEPGWIGSKRDSFGGWLIRHRKVLRLPRVLSKGASPLAVKPDATAAKRTASRLAPQFCSASTTDFPALAGSHTGETSRSPGSPLSRQT